MSDRQKLATTYRTPQSQRFVGSRWLELARGLAKRYRKRRFLTGLAMLWPRRFVQVRWLRERLFQPQRPAHWQLNLGLNLSLHATTRVEDPSWAAAQQTPEQGVERAPLSDQFARQRFDSPQTHGPNLERTTLANHFVMQRFVSPQASIVLPQMRTLIDRSVHTSVRPVVRENLHTEDRVFSKPFAEHSARPEADRRDHLTIPAQGMSAPAAVPIRASDINVTQLADQVMRLLDHRISAWRERRGRS